MGADQNWDWAKAAASALEWWHDAGVDVLVEDTAVDWLSLPPEPVVEPALLSDRAPRDGGAERPAAPLALPDTLDAFVAWRAGADAPDARWGGTPIAAAGPVGATTMVLVDCPEREDRASLMEGAEGRLLARMLAAIGVARDAALVASVCARRPTTGRVPRDVEARLGEIARHHVALASPKKLLVLGDAASRAILGTNVGEARGRLHSIYHKDGTITLAVASWHPRNMLDRPVLKAEAWKDLLMLDRGQAA